MNEVKTSVKRGGHRFLSVLQRLFRKHQSHLNVIQQHAVKFKRSEKAEDEGRMRQLLSLQQGSYSWNVFSSEMMKQKQKVCRK